jgi:hypothetical protein
MTRSPPENDRLVKRRRRAEVDPQNLHKIHVDTRLAPPLPRYPHVPQRVFTFNSNNLNKTSISSSSQSPSAKLSLSASDHRLLDPLSDAPVRQPPSGLPEPSEPQSPIQEPVQTRPRGDTFSRSPTSFPRISTPLLWQLLDDSNGKRTEPSPRAGSSPASPRPRSPDAIPPAAPDTMAANGQLVAAGPELAEISTNVGRTIVSRIV